MDENRKFYFEYERRFPNHLIIQKEGIFYNAYGYSARVLSQIMQLETREAKGRISTGSTRAAIIDTLKSEDYSFPFPFFPLISPQDWTTYYHL